MTYSTSRITPLILTLTACAEPFPAEPVREFGNFGAEVYALLHDEFLWSGTPAEGAARAAAFSAHRDDLVWALDIIASGPVSDGILPLLETYLPLYEDRTDGKPGPLPKMTRDLSAILAELAADPSALEALARLGTAPEANPSATTHLLGTLARHPIDLLDPLVDLTLDLEPALTQLFTWLYRELPTLEESYVVRSDEKTLVQRVLDVELAVTTEPIGPPVMSARFDGRGAPIVRPRADGSLPPPFVDLDGDGQIDVDLFARPLDASGLVINLPTFAYAPTADEARDPLGRALIDGALVYDYFDLRQSLVAFLLRDARSLLNKGAHHDLFWAFDALLGGRVNRTDQDGPYTGFFAEDAPLIDLAFALNELRRYDRLVPLTRALAQLVIEEEPLFRGLVMDLAKARAIFTEAPSLTEGHALFEDLHPALSSLAKGGGLRALFAASRKPGTDRLFPAMVAMMRHTSLDTPTDMKLLDSPDDIDRLALLGPTPWDVPDTSDSQRSWLQKTAYLMNDTKGAPVYLKLFDTVRVEDVAITRDMARFYVDAIAGRARLDLSPDLLEDLAVELVAEFDDTLLQAEELNLYMNHDQPVTGNPVGNRGVQIRNGYGPALLAIQASGSLEGLTPWVTDLVALDLASPFVDLFDVLARHYSESAFTDGPFTSDGTGFRRLEPYLVRVLEETDLADHFLALSAWADRTRLDVDGQSIQVADELDRFVTWLLDPDANISLRNGQTAIPGVRGPIRPSRLQLLTHAFDRIDMALDAAPEARAAWDRVDLLGTFLDLDDSGALLNPHALDALVALIPILADEAAQAIALPDWTDSLDTLVPDLIEAMGSRGFTALIDAMRQIRDTPRHRAFVDALIASVLAEAPPNPDADLMGATLGALSTLAQTRIPIDALTRLLRYGGRLLEPAKRRVFAPLESLREMRALDPARLTSALALNLFLEPEVAKTPIGVLTDALKSALRAVPGASGPYSSDDLALVIGRFADWLVDDHKGMEHLYEVIRGR
jgi:hypothetical protein